MKVVPVASPHAMHAANTTDNASAKARAVAAFMQGGQPPVDPPQHPPTAQQTAGLNPNSVSPEEMSAVKSAVIESNGDPNNAPIGSQPDTSTATEPLAATPAPKPETPDPALSRQFAQLARQEKLLRQKAQAQDQAMKAREDALKAQETAITAKQAQYEQGYISLDQLKADTLGILAKAGISYDEVTQQILNQQPANPRVDAHIARLEAEIKALQAKATKAESDQQAQSQSAYQAALKQIRSDATNLVKTDPTYETIKATNSISDVVELIEQTFQKDGHVMSVEEACNEVENYLVEEAIKLTNVDKIKKRISQNVATTPRVTQQTPAPAAQPQQTQRPMNTLTNATASTRKLSAKERAILAFKGELGKS